HHGPRTTPTYTLSLHDALPIYFTADLNPSVQNILQDAIKTLESLGVTFVEVDLPNNHLSVPAYYVIAPAEASANLSRYDGVRFGDRKSTRLNSSHVKISYAVFC